MTTFFKRAVFISVELSLVALVLGTALFVMALTMQQGAFVLKAHAQTASSTVSIHVEKKFSGDAQGFTENQFSFHITGNGVNQTVAHDGTISLPEGTYTLEEVGPSGFDQGLWRAQWSGECEDNDSNDSDATIVVDSGNVDYGTLECRADNQFRPEDAVNDTRTVQLDVTKKFSGDAQGLTENQFSYKITGGSISQTVVHGGNILLPIGTYTIEEIGPVGFNQDDWRVQWSGDVCSDDDGDDSDATIVIDASDLNKSATYCRADNQYRPDAPDDGDGGGDGNGGAHGTVTVYKVVINDNSGIGTTSDFTINATGVTPSITSFTASASGTAVTFGVGSYSITESSVSGYDVSYSSNCTGTISGGENKTCTITNNDKGGDGGSPGDGDGGGGDGGGDGDGGGNGNNDGDGDANSTGGGGGGNNNNSGGGGDNNNDGEVAGAQTQVIPMGAANGGFGGTSNTDALRLSIVLSLFGMMLGTFMLRKVA